MGKRELKVTYYKRRTAFILVLFICCTFGYSLFAQSQSKNKQNNIEESLEERWEKATNNTSLNTWNLILVNEENPLPEEIELQLYDVGNGQQIDQRIAKEYEQLMEAANDEGFELAAVSGYRSVDYQTELYYTSIENYLNQGYSQEGAEEMTKRYIQVPGASEHHTGLAVDIASEEFKISGQELTNELENTAEFKWMQKNAADYGFVLRYPEGKEKVTGIGYEPWHFRYVGKKPAKFLEKNQLTLEELYDEMKGEK